MSIETIKGFRVIVTHDNEDQCTIIETTDYQVIARVSYGLSYTDDMKKAFECVPEFFKRRAEED